MYGAYWCGHCANQKALFGDAFKYIDYVECDARGTDANPFLCAQKGISSVPVWEIAGQFYLGAHSLEELAWLSGLALVGEATPSPSPTPTPTPTATPVPPSPTPTSVPVPQQATTSCSPAIESNIDGEFTGWEGETIFKTLNGQIWLQVDYSYHYTYAYMPKVTISLAGGGCRMQVEGVQATIAVIQVEAIESRISGTFEGFQYERVYLLRNGQTWQQTSLDISIALRLSPRVIIYRGIAGEWRMQVEGSSRTIRVTRLK